MERKNKKSDQKKLLSLSKLIRSFHCSARKTLLFYIYIYIFTYSSKDELSF